MKLRGKAERKEKRSNGRRKKTADLQAPILLQNVAMFNFRGNHLLGRFLLPPSSAPLLLEVDMVVDLLSRIITVCDVVVVVDLMFFLINSMWRDRDFAGSER